MLRQLYLPKWTAGIVAINKYSKLLTELVRAADIHETSTMCYTLF